MADKLIRIPLCWSSTLEHSLTVEPLRWVTVGWGGRRLELDVKSKENNFIIIYYIYLLFLYKQ